ncbi:LAME_0F11518g1_1 [Lachancea meyersii CBS 8951]|uniref:LAME_0F11518g1_1 n=1 Tax=Lachancea meyersii CBS 8951 TaxID=1266667 RepID=A0A1G4JW52_9SACH|nr:LAME_0F11518g1_1 [Lachancea meyersii CBS 8951]
MEGKSFLGLASDEKTQVPAKVFRCQALWAIRDVFKWRKFQIVAAIFVGLICASVVGLGRLFQTHGAGKVAYLLSAEFAFLGIELFFAATVIFIEQKKKTTVRQQRMELFRQIMAQQPGTALAKWDVIAVEMNDYLNKQAIWHSPWCFYDGAMLFAFFRTLIYIPLQDGKFDSDAEIVLLRDAAQNYEESLFASENENEKTGRVSNLSSEKKLPVELHHSKATWVLTRSKKMIVIGSLYALVYGWFGQLLAVVIFECFHFAISFYVFWNRANFLSLADSLEFMNNVHKFEPWEDDSKWDEIARATNAAFSGKRMDNFDNDYFFDGNHCRQLFKQRLSSIIADRKLRLPELIPFAHELRAACGFDSKDQV